MEHGFAAMEHGYAAMEHEWAAMADEPAAVPSNIRNRGEDRSSNYLRSCCKLRRYVAFIKAKTGSAQGGTFFRRNKRQSDGIL
ncbi:hypothetical protein Trydic_g4330 [Trypoxylus dichotomus]